MNEPDPIVAEVRRIREAHAAQFNYDPKAIFRDIKEQEKKSGRKFVSFAGAPSEGAPKQAPQSSGAAIPVAPDSKPPEPAKL